MRKSIPFLLCIPMSYLFSCVAYNNKIYERHNERLSRIPGRVTIMSDGTIKDFNLLNGTPQDSSHRLGCTTKRYSVARRNAPDSLFVQSDSAERIIKIKPDIPSGYSLFLSARNGEFIVSRIIYGNRLSNPAIHSLLSASGDSVINPANRVVPPIKKGRIDLRFNWLLVNDIDIKQHQNNFDRTAAVAGISIGLNYYTKHNQYISVDAGVASTPGLGGSESYNAVDTTRTSNVVYGNVKYNNTIGRFEFGYGIHLSHYNLNFDITDSIAPQTYKDISQTYSNTSLGISLSAQFRIARYMNIGVQFQPNIISLSKTVAGMKYRSNTSFYVNFVLPVRR